jgi:cytochrome c553
MLFRKVAIRSSSSFWGRALARLPAAGSRRRVSLLPLVLHGFLWALVVSLPRLALAQNVTSGTVVYGTGQSGTNWAGGSIAAGATLAKQALCGTCHLPTYLGQSQVPRLAGQREDYLRQTMVLMRDGKAIGRDSIMSSTLRGMSDDQLRDLSYFFASIGAKP